MPSILRNSSRYRRDQRQLDEEEEIWFNEEEDFADSNSNNKAGSPELDTSLGERNHHSNLVAGGVCGGGKKRKRDSMPGLRRIASSSSLSSGKGDGGLGGGMDCGE